MPRGGHFFENLISGATRSDENWKRKESCVKVWAVVAKSSREQLQSPGHSRKVQQKIEVSMSKVEENENCEPHLDQILACSEEKPLTMVANRVCRYSLHDLFEDINDPICPVTFGDLVYMGQFIEGASIPIHYGALNPANNTLWACHHTQVREDDEAYQGLKFSPRGEMGNGRVKITKAIRYGDHVWQYEFHAHEMYFAYRKYQEKLLLHGPYLQPDHWQWDRTLAVSHRCHMARYHCNCYEHMKLEVKDDNISRSNHNCFLYLICSGCRTSMLHCPHCGSVCLRCKWVSHCSHCRPDLYLNLPAAPVDYVFEL